MNASFLWKINNLRAADSQFNRPSSEKSKNQWWSESGHLKIFTQFRSPVFLSHEWLLVPNGFLFSREFQNYTFCDFQRFAYLWRCWCIFNLSLRTFFAKSQNFLSDSLPIILAINKSDFRCAVVRFCYYSYDYRPNWTPLSPITITYYAHKESSLTCVARARFELLSYYEK